MIDKNKGFLGELGVLYHNFSTFGRNTIYQMITFITGKLVEKKPTEVVLDTNGIGYLLFVSLHTSSQIGEVGQQITLHTHLQIKEDAHTLYGFFDVFERKIFQLLIGVSGIGASTARTMLSSLTALEVQRAIVNADVPTIQSVKGIGSKTAQRLVIELKDKALKLESATSEQEMLTGQGTTSLNKPQNTLQSASYQEASLALETLGFTPKNIAKVLQQITKEYVSTQQVPSTEEIIKLALKKI